MNNDIIRIMCMAEMQVIYEQIETEILAIAHSITQDGADPELADRFIQKALEETDRIQVVVNNYRATYGADVIPLDWNFDE